VGYHIKVRKADKLVAAVRTSTDAEQWEPPILDAFEWVKVDALPDDAGSATYRFEDGAFHPAQRPVTAADVTVVARRELAASDWRAASDRPPMSPEWTSYRQTMRDIINSATDVLSMIAAFPRRPDGTDPIAQMRQANG